MKSTIRSASSGNQNGNYLHLGLSNASFCIWFKIVLLQKIKFLISNLKCYQLGFSSSQLFIRKISSWMRQQWLKHSKVQLSTFALAPNNYSKFWTCSLGQSGGSESTCQVSLECMTIGIMTSSNIKQNSQKLCKSFTSSSASLIFFARSVQTAHTC